MPFKQSVGRCSWERDRQRTGKGPTDQVEGRASSVEGTTSRQYKLGRYESGKVGSKLIVKDYGLWIEDEGLKAVG